MIASRLTAYLKDYLYTLDAIDKLTINNNDIFHLASTKMKKFRKRNNKKYKK